MENKVIREATGKRFRKIFGIKDYELNFGGTIGMRQCKRLNDKYESV